MTWPPPNPDEWVYLLKPAALVENVECQTCGGDGNRRPFLDKHTPDDPCLDCKGTGRVTPENVEASNE